MSRRGPSAWGLIAWLAYVLGVAALIIYAAASSVRADSAVPGSASTYKRVLAGEAQAAFGLSAPVARLAAQVHQESAWRPDARSRFAEGLAQFTPSTSVWIAGLFPDKLAPADPWDPRWAIRAMVLYDHWLSQQIDGRGRPLGGCARWAMVLSAYNGGLGWLQRDRSYAAEIGKDPDAWFGDVQWYSRRSGWAMKENRDYVARILLELEPVYVSSGWPGEVVCVG